MRYPRIPACLGVGLLALMPMVGQAQTTAPSTTAPAAPAPAAPPPVSTAPATPAPATPAPVTPAPAAPAPTAAAPAPVPAAPSEAEIRRVTRQASVGRVSFSGHAYAAGIGFTRANGTLRYRGHTYHFTLRGLSLLDIGYESISAYGTIYNLHRLSEFSGTYAAASAEATAGRGHGVEYLRNGNGVVIRVDSVSRGARLQASADGLQITLDR